jgi:hypothetical protein
MYAALDELSHFLAVRPSAANGEHSNSKPAEPVADTRVTVLFSRVDLINSAKTRWLLT